MISKLGPDFVHRVAWLRDSGGIISSLSIKAEPQVKEFFSVMIRVPLFSSCYIYKIGF